MHVLILTGPQMSETEQIAVSDLKGYVKGLFDLETVETTAPDGQADAVFIVGNPETNPAAAAAWEKVSQQGILLKRCQWRDKPALVVGGGSPAATLWAVSRLAELYGVRHLLHGDVYPDGLGDFYLPEVNLRQEPDVTARSWRVINDFACGPESWGLADYRPVLHQLAKMTFNRIFVSIYPWQPFLDLQIDGLKRNWATLWYDFKYPITPDMPARQLFGDEMEFWNPDLPPRGAPYRELAAAGERHVHELITCANGLGMQSAITVNILEFPKEFAPIVPGAEPVHQLGQLTVVPGADVDVDDPQLFHLAASVLRATIDTYPEVDFYALALPEFVSWTDVYTQAWGRLDRKYDVSRVISCEEVLADAREHDVIYDDNQQARAVTEAKANIVALYFMDKLLTHPQVLPQTKKPDAKFYLRGPAALQPILPLVVPGGSEILQNLAYTPARALRRRDAIRRMGTGSIPTNTVFSLHDDNVGVVPQLCTGSLHEILTEMREAGWTGFTTRYWLISDHDPCLTYLSRASWDESTTPEDVYNDQVAALCGQAAVAPMLEAFKQLESVTVALENHGMGLTFPVSKMGTKHFTAEPTPEELLADRQAYQRAAEAVRRVPEPKRPEGKQYVEYWLRRFEFALLYFDMIETLRRAGATYDQAAKARAADDEESYRARLAEAIDGVRAAEKTARQAIETYAGIARDRSDCGAIATMAEYLVRDLGRLGRKLAGEAPGSARTS